MAVEVAQHLGERRPLGRHAGGLDGVEERRADPAEQQQRDHPPRHRQRRRQQPPSAEPQPLPVRPVTGPPDQGRQAPGQRGHGVDRAHQRHRHPGPGRQPARIEPRVHAHGQEHRQQDPRRQHHRQRLRRDRPQGREHPWRQRERSGGQQPRPGVADAECLGHPQQTPEAHRQQPRPPQPLGHPTQQSDQVSGEEERPVREQVSVRLVLRLPERQVAVPQIGGPGQEAQRVGGQVQLGVRRDHAGRLHERQQQRGGTDQPQPAAGQPCRKSRCDIGAQIRCGCRIRRG